MPVRSYLTKFGVLTAHPAAFIILAMYMLAWLAADPSTLLTWGSGAELATLVMALMIQRAEHRDTQAIHAKLDELLRANEGARTELTRLDEQDPEDIEEHRRQARKQDAPN